MIRKKNILLFGALWGACSALPAQAADITWKNDFTFYGDNTEFFEPYRTGETLLGQQGKSRLEAALGTRAFLSAGVFADFRSTSDVDPAVDVKPLLSIEYREGGTRLVMGTLETRDRHGFLEPLEATFLEFTRPVEYGLQWTENDPAFQCDFFLNWHQLNTPTQPEQMDYGGVWKEPIDENFRFEEELHGFHDGGQLYATGGIVNNWVPALGFRWKVPGLLGSTQFDAFGILSGLLMGDNTGGTQYGGGGYLKVEISPDANFGLFGIGWKGRNFYSQEGDANYASYSTPDSTSIDQIHGFVKADRTYAEIGARREFPLEGGALFEAEFRVHFIDEYTAYSYRLAVYAPLDVFLLSTPKEAKPSRNENTPQD